MTNRVLTVFLGLSVAVIICWLLQVLKFVFLPIVMAVFITFLLNPLVKLLTRFKVPLFLAVTLTIMVAMLVGHLAGTILLSRLVAFQDQFPKYEIRLSEMISQAKELQDLSLGPINADSIRRELGKLSLSSTVGSALNSFFTFLTYILFTIVLVIYFLMGSPSMPNKIRRAFSQDRAERINNSMENISRQVRRYILAKTMTSILTGGIVTGICLAFQIDFPVTWGFFTFLLNFIPTIGVFIACVPIPVMSLIQYGDWAGVLWITLILIAVMMTLGNLIEPKILGDSVNLSPLVVLFSLIIWGWLWGPAGMIVAVPITALLKSTCDHIDGLRPVGVLLGREA